MNDFDQFERRLAAAIRSDADQSVGPFDAGSIAHAAIVGTQPGATRLRRASVRPTARFGRGRGIPLLAAAALLLVAGALAAGAGILRLPSIVPPVPPATSPSPSDLAGPTAGPTRSAAPGLAGVWIATGTMGTPRFGFTAVRLLDGRVLVAGGNGSSGSGDSIDLTSAELYDPDSGTWSATGKMVGNAGLATATLLRDGKVLVVGGGRAQLYDPASGTWTAIGKIVSGDGVATATLLRDGKVLVVGSNGGQLYDPDRGTWSATGKMITPRYNHTATLLLDGRVLVAGGDVWPDRAVDSAELYDPGTGSWTATANMRATGNPRYDIIRATLLRDGTVLVVRPTSTTLYDPGTGTWTPTGDLGSPGAPFTIKAATRLLDGTVLVWGSLGDDPAAVEVYDPATASWTKTGSMLPDSGGDYPESRQATLLLDGTVLVSGGAVCSVVHTGCPTGATGSAELYIPAGVSPPTGLTPVPSPTPTPTPTPIPTPYLPKAGPVPTGARSWKVTVVNKSSEPGTLFLAPDDGSGMANLCGSVTPNVVPAGVTEQVTFLLPAKRVTSCWIWVNPVPGQGGSLFQTSDAPMAGEFVITEGEHGPQGAWLSR
jgi:hypothetical protein